MKISKRFRDMTVEVVKNVLQSQQHNIKRHRDAVIKMVIDNQGPISLT